MSKYFLAFIVLSISLNILADTDPQSYCEAYYTGSIASKSSQRTIIKCDCQCSDEENDFTVTEGKNSDYYKFSRYIEQKDLVSSLNQAKDATALMCTPIYKSILKIKNADWFLIAKPMDKPPRKCFEPLALIGNRILNYKMQDVTKDYDGSGDQAIPTAIVNVDKAYIYATPELSSKKNGFYLKNDSIELIEKPSNGWVHIVYSKHNNKVFKGWLKIEDVKLD